MGRRPKTAAELKATGQYRADRHKGRDRIALEPGNAVKPQWLTGVESTALWRRVAPPLAAAGVLSCLDGEVLAMGCFWYGEARKSARLLQQARNADDRRKLSLTASLAWREASNVFGKFGLTPSDRASLGVGVSRVEHDASRALAEKFGIIG